MKKFNKFIAMLALMVSVPVCLASCTGDDGGNNNYSNNENTKKTISITSNNAGNFFNMNVQSARKTYESGYVMHYKISIQLIGNYKLNSDINFEIKTTCSYWVTTTTDTMKLTMSKGSNFVSKEDTIVFSKHLDEISSFNWSCVCTSASGTIIAN